MVQGGRTGDRITQAIELRSSALQVPKCQDGIPGVGRDPGEGHPGNRATPPVPHRHLGAKRRLQYCGGLGRVALGEIQKTDPVLCRCGPLRCSGPTEQGGRGTVEPLGVGMLVELHRQVGLRQRDVSPDIGCDVERIAEGRTLTEFINGRLEQALGGQRGSQALSDSQGLHNRPGPIKDLQRGRERLHRRGIISPPQAELTQPA